MLRSDFGKPLGSSDPGLHQRGTTLLELTVAMTAMVVVLGSAVIMMVTTTDSSGEAQVDLVNLRDRLEGVDEIRSDLGRAKFADCAANGSTVTYMVPVSLGPDGSIFDEAGTVLWGSVDSEGPEVGGSYQLGFDLTRVVHESEEDIDMNGDGDMSDSFDEGRIFRQSESGEHLGFPPVKVFLPNGNHGADIDGDGRADPLFRIADDGRIVITLARRKQDGTLEMSTLSVKAAERNL